mgnify:CR=1 FL=1
MRIRKKIEYKEEIKSKNKKTLILAIVTFLLIGFLLTLLIDISNNAISQISGFIVSEITENQKEEIKERFDKDLDLEIKKPPKLANKIITKNKNERMDFDIDGGLRLYFDLLNYSEFIETTGETLIEEGLVNEEEILEPKIEKITEDIANLKKTGEQAFITSITGNIIRFLGITGKVVITDLDVNEVNVSKVREKIDNLTDEKIDEIEDQSILKLNIEEFEIEVNETKAKENNVDYKWGYKVKLKDLNFLAKIDITSNQTITIQNEYSLKIGNNILSFQDLVKEGYTVRIKKPSLEIEAITTNISRVIEKNLTIIQNITQINETISNFTGNITTNITVSNETQINETVSNITEDVSNLTLGSIIKGIGNASISNETINNETKVEIISNVTENVSNVTEIDKVEGTKKELIEEVEEKEKKDGERKVEEVSEKPILNETIEPSITGNAIKFVIGLTGKVINNIVNNAIRQVEIQDIEYENVITVYIERDFTNNSENIEAGDIITLDPTIIQITKAQHLDENRSFISDIYDLVKAKDNNWSEIINDNHYVRVTFEKNLTNKNDITFYARAVNENISSEIGIYRENDDQLISSITNIITENWYKVYLTGLHENESRDIFDLKVLGNIEFDYIVDPTFGTLDVNITSPTDNLQINQNTTFEINATVTCKGIAGDVCGNISAFARYNGSTASPDTKINITYLESPFFTMVSNLSDGFDVGSAGAGDLQGITFDPTDNSFWVMDIIDDFAYHFNSTGSNQTDGFETGPAGSLSPRGIAFDPTDNSFWIVDDSDAFIYHFNSTGSNQTDGFNVNSTGAGNPQEIDFDPTDNSFWVVDQTDLFAYHFNSTGSNQTDGFDVSSAGSFSSRGIAFDPTDNSFWVVDNVDDFAYHFNSTGSNQTDGFKVDSAGAASPIGITFDPTDNSFWVVDQTDLFAYHFLSGKNPKVSINLSRGQSFNITWLVNGTEIGEWEIDVFFNSSYGNVSVQENNTKDMTIIVNIPDLIPPNLNFTKPTPFSGDLVYEGNLLVNITFSGASNASVYLYNSTKNEINKTTSTTSPLFLNFSNLSSGVYYFNASAIDSSNNVNTTVLRNVLIINPNLTGDGSVKSEYKINESRFGNGNELSGDNFGVSVSNLGDLNNDGVQDIIIGEYGNDDGGAGNGAVWIMFLNTNGSVKSSYKINESRFGNGNELSGDNFGVSVSNIGDLNNDGIQDIIIGEDGNDDGGASNGAVWIMFLNTSGGVKSEYKINESRFGNGSELGGDQFGTSLSNLGDLDGDGMQDIVVGAYVSNDGGLSNGAVWIMFLNKTAKVTTSSGGASESSSGGSGGTGLGAGITGESKNQTMNQSKGPLFEIDKNEFNITIIIGDIEIREFKIKNLNENNLNIEINVEGIADLIDIENSISLKGFEEKNVRFEIFSPERLDIRTGDIKLSLGAFSKEISVIINPKSPSVLKKITDNKTIIRTIIDLIDIKTLLTSPELSCADLQELSIIELENACYNSLTDDIELIISRKQFDIIIDSLTFVINGDSESSWTCGNSCGGCNILEQGEKKTYYFSPLNPEKQEIARLYISSCELGEIKINDCNI